MNSTELLSLLSQNNLAEFFRAWPNTVHPTSPLNATLRSLRADWTANLQDFIQGNREDDGSKGIREKAFALVDRIGPEDLEERAATISPDQPARPTSQRRSSQASADELKSLIQEKIAFLRQSLVLAIDPSAKFAMQKEITALEQQLKSLS